MISCVSIRRYILRVDFLLRGVLFADLFELFVPGGSAIVGLLFEPGDHVRVLVKVNPFGIPLLTKCGEKQERDG